MATPRRDPRRRATGTTSAPTTTDTTQADAAAAAEPADDPQPTPPAPAQPADPAEPADPPQAPVPPADTPPAGGTPPPVIPTAAVQKGDVWIMAAVAGVAMVVLVAFGIALFVSGLIRFPDMTLRDPSTGFFTEGQDYRERRNTLALILRTFVTGFSFVVGLALSTMGGLFILRQVTSLTTIGGALGGSPLAAAPADPATDPAAEGGGVRAAMAKTLRETQFSFSAYSPGVVFLVGGVVVMVATQYFAIPINTLEVVPKAAVSAFCYDTEAKVWKECAVGEVSPPAPAPAPAPAAATEPGTPLPAPP